MEKPQNAGLNLFIKFHGMVLAIFILVCNGLGKENLMTVIVESSAFNVLKAIPQRYTCDGNDVSPPLRWKKVPDKTKSFALICDDPDAPMGTWVHWVCYDIPQTCDSLDENIIPSDSLPHGGKQGANDFGKIGYGGPCPPSGTHRYFFKVYALDAILGLPAGRTKKDIEHAMKGHILAQGELVGNYSRK